MKGKSAAVWIFAALLGAGAPALAQSRVGFVSLERILREAPAAQRAQKKLEREFSKRGQDVSKMAEQLKKVQEDMDRNSVTMSRGAKPSASRSRA